MGSVKIRNAKPTDTDIIYKIGVKENAFAVSSMTKFYEKHYLRNWINSPDGDILLVAEMGNQIVGFLFCRVIHRTWAMLENIAVVPSKRRQGIGSLLLDECIKRLRSNRINYLAGILREGNRSTEFFIRRGFSFGNRFVWIERTMAKRTLRKGR